MQCNLARAAALGGVLVTVSLAAADATPLPRGFSRVALSSSFTATEPGTGAPIRVDEFPSGPVRLSLGGEIVAYTVERRVTYTAASPSYYRSTFTGNALSPRTGVIRNLGDLTVTCVSQNGAYVCGIERGVYDSRTGFASPPRGRYYILGWGGGGGDEYMPLPVGSYLTLPGFFPTAAYHEAVAEPFMLGLDVPAVDGTLTGNAFIYSGPPTPLALPVDAVPGSVSQVATSFDPPVAASYANVMRNLAGGGTARAGVYWLGTTPRYLPTTDGLATQFTAATRGGRYVLGRVLTPTGSYLCYWAIAADNVTYIGPYGIVDGVSDVFHDFRFTAGTGDGVYFVGTQAGFFGSSGFVNTSVGTFEAGAFFAAEFPGYAQPPAAQPISTVDGVADGGVVFAGVGTELSGGLPLGPSYVWVFNRICGLADLGRAGGYQGADGVLDNNDFIAMIGMFFRQDVRVDLGSAGGVAGADGAWDNNDFIVFINAFFGGC